MMTAHPRLAGPQSGRRVLFSQLWGKTLFFILPALIFFQQGHLARAQANIRFEAQASPAAVSVGDPITFTLKIEVQGRLNIQPTLPDWGGLIVSGGPSTQQQYRTDGSGMRMTLNYIWELTAPRPGRYTIGPSEINNGIRAWQTNPITITVSAPPPPPTLGNDPNALIMPARTRAPQLNQQLKDRLFLRATISNRNPYVGEPVIIDYTLFNGGVNIRS